MSERTEHYLWLEFKYSNIVLEPDRIDYPDKVDKIFCDIKYQPINEEYEPVGEPIKIGYMILNFYNIGMGLHNGLSSFWVIDEESDISWVLIDKESDRVRDEIIRQVGPSLNLNILEGERFVMNPEYRNKGLGEEALKGLVTMFKSKVGYFAFKSFPLQKEHKDVGRLSEDIGEDHWLNGLESDMKKAQRKLNAFYRRCGFKMVRKIPNYFIMNMDPVILWV